ncbi:MAG: Holliday junction branch migration protein RuvA [Erysipelotrichales bacterium]|nr:Holliday junction branch migration protein RuvA [Erysipelotrichales bacterium]
MYAYIKGTIVEINSTNIIIDHQGIGYLVNVPNPYIFKKNEETIIYLYQHIREDSNMLFGFATKNAKELFLKLINVSGIGPKTALGLLVTDEVERIVSAIDNMDYKFLTKFPGIGQKASQQIVLDLKGKIAIETAPDYDNKKLQDLEDTLVFFGHNQKDIRRVIPNLDVNKDLKELLQEAKSLLTK